MVYGDDVYMGKPSYIQQLVDTYNEYQSPILEVMRKDQDGDYDKYGYVSVKEDRGNGVYLTDNVVEKPGKDNKISPYAQVSAMVLTPDIFQKLETQKPGKGGEIWLTEAVNALAQERDVYAKEVTGVKYFDCGNKLEYLKATVEFALEREDLGEEFRAYLKNLLG